MVYTNSDYYADLGLMRSTASAIGADGVRKTLAAPNPYSFTINEPVRKSVCEA